MNDVTKTKGWLRRQTDPLKQWKDRYFSIEEDRVLCARTQDLHNPDVLLAKRIQRIVAEKREKNSCLRIDIYKKKIYLLAKDQRERNAWVRDLQNWLERSRQGSFTIPTTESFEEEPTTESLSSDNSITLSSDEQSELLWTNESTTSPQLPPKTLPSLNDTQDTIVEQPISFSIIEDEKSSIDIRSASEKKDSPSEIEVRTVPIVAEENSTLIKSEAEQEIVNVIDHEKSSSSDIGEGFRSHQLEEKTELSQNEPNKASNLEDATEATADSSDIQDSGSFKGQGNTREIRVEKDEHIPSIEEQLEPSPSSVGMTSDNTEEEEPFISEYHEDATLSDQNDEDLVRLVVKDFNIHASPKVLQKQKSAQLESGKESEDEDLHSSEEYIDNKYRDEVIPICEQYASLLGSHTEFQDRTESKLSSIRDVTKLLHQEILLLRKKIQGSNHGKDVSELTTEMSVIANGMDTLKSMASEDSILTNNRLCLIEARLDSIEDSVTQISSSIMENNKLVLQSTMQSVLDDVNRIVQKQVLEAVTQIQASVQSYVSDVVENTQEVSKEKLSELKAREALLAAREEAIDAAKREWVSRLTEDKSDVSERFKISPLLESYQFSPSRSENSSTSVIAPCTRSSFQSHNKFQENFARSAPSIAPGHSHTRSTSRTILREHPRSLHVPDNDYIRSLRK